MRIVLFFLFLFASTHLQAQLPEPDMYNNITVQPVVHGSLMLEYNGKVIYADPYGGAERYTSLPEPDIILITDIHGDHYNEETLRAVFHEDVLIAAPLAVRQMMPSEIAEKTVIISNGETKDIGGVTVEAVPMYNLPEDEESRHPKGRGNGYILDLDGTRVYISGDTEDIPEMRALQNIDLAFVCMNMPYTMTVEQAADAVLEFKPEVVYPYHYRGRPEISDTSEFRQLVKAENNDIEVRLKNWYTGE
ncbi:MBL fold metallo-hydrolase [Robertkochia aurantiaca]|uniref:MBL fold metallo-hydrolase n=1 Tax=Robertkochia aurantiaca TaxID=2873700 RepID=UPI001CCE33C2|nr:MBL fold metallo-hydrolase [Robertkochia sp. 3YJGBD-33]